MNKLDQGIEAIALETIPEQEAEQAAARVRQKLFPQTHGGSDRLRGCADYEALIPAYLAKTLSAGRCLLLQDHTRECPACRNRLEQGRAGNVRTLTRPTAPPTRTIPKFWAIAAMLALVAGTGALVLSRTSLLSQGRIAVQSVSGILYLMSSNGKVTPIFAGREIPEGANIRTAKESKAIIRLGDGSLVEINERAEISVVRSGGGTAIHLDHGNIIVQAAKQKNGTLDVLTPDCAVSVKGTIFAVDRGIKGSRVSVVEGAVQVAQGSSKHMLKPGQQVSTDPSAAATSVQEAVSWSRDSARYLALLGEFSSIQKGLEAMPSPALRHNSKLLSYVPQDAVLYAAIPNVGSTLGEAQRLFNARLQESPVLRQWWEQQKEGPRMQAMLEKLRTFSDYLGDEIVFSISGDREGNYSRPMLLAEVNKPGLDAFLNNEFRQLSLHGAAKVPQLMAIPQPGDASERFYGRRSRYATGAQAEQAPMLVGIKDGLLAVAWDQREMENLGSRLADQTPAGEILGGNVQQAYERGVGWLLCVNMEQITRHTVNTPGGANGPKLPAGLDSMRYLLVERRDVSGKTENQATLTFEGNRAGIAGWLAEPAPMGSLDFISPNATFAVSMVLRTPWILNDLVRSMNESHPDLQNTLDRMRQQSNFAIGQNLARPLGGEFTFAVDGPVLPLPSWKLAVEVYNPDALQSGIEQMVAAVNADTRCADCKLTLTNEQSAGRTYYTLTSAKIAYEIDYTFVDGYFLAAPSRALLNTAIQNRATGYVLARSEGFRSQLPAGGNLNVSGLVYQNIGTALKPFANQIGSMAAASPAQRQSIQALAENSGPGLIYLYGQPDRITVASNGAMFGLDLNSLALPSLLSRGMQLKGAPAQ